MAIRGSLREASLPDVLQLLSMGKKTGCLSVTHKNNFGYIYFNKGRICYASIVNRRDRLGDMLVKTGVISQAQLDAAIELQDRRRDTATRRAARRTGRADAAATARRDQRADPGSGVFPVHLESGHVQLRGGRRSGSARLRRVDQSGVAAARGRAPRRRVGADREEDSRASTSCSSVDRARIAESDVALTDEWRSVLDLVDGSARRAAHHRRLGPGGVRGRQGAVRSDERRVHPSHRQDGGAGRTGRDRRTRRRASQPRHRVLQDRRCSTKRFASSVACSSCAATIAVARFYIGLVLARQRKWEDALASFSEAAAQPTANVAVLHNLAYALEQLQSLRRSAHRARRSGASRRRRRPARADVARRPESARRRSCRGRCGAHRGASAVRQASADARLVPLHGTDRRAARRRRAVARRSSTKAWSRIRTPPCCSTTSRRCSSATPTTTARERSPSVASRKIRGVAQLHKNLGDLYYRAARYDDALEAYVRATKVDPELGADMYLKLGNIKLRRQEREEAVRCWERALELDPDNAIVRTNLESVRQVF